MRQPHFSIRYVGGPLDGRSRNIERSPQELASAVAMPVERAAARWRAPQRLAVYQLHNENGEWSYCHIRTASAEELGVPPDKAENETQRLAEWAPV